MGRTKFHAQLSIKYFLKSLGLVNIAPQTKLVEFVNSADHGEAAHEAALFGSKLLAHLYYA